MSNLKFYQRLILQYIEPAMCFLTFLMAVFAPLQLVKNVFYYETDPDIDNPIILVMVKYAGIITNIFGMALYGVCNISDLALQKKIFFLIFLLGDLPMMGFLTMHSLKISLNTPFWLGTIISIVLAVVRLSVLFNEPKENSSDNLESRLKERKERVN